MRFAGGKGAVAPGALQEMMVSSRAEEPAGHSSSRGGFREAAEATDDPMDEDDGPRKGVGTVS